MDAYTYKNIKFLATNIILGHLCNDNCYLPINTIITVTKYYIFSCAVNKRTPSFSVLKNKLKKQYEDQFSVSVESGKK